MISYLSEHPELKPQIITTADHTGNVDKTIGVLENMKTIDVN